MNVFVIFSRQVKYKARMNDVSLEYDNNLKSSEEN